MGIFQKSVESVLAFSSLHKRREQYCSERISCNMGIHPKSLHTADPWLSLKDFQGVHKVKTHFIRIVRHYLPSDYIDVCTAGAKAMKGKNTGALEQFKAVTPNLLVVIVSFNSIHSG